MSLLLSCFVKIADMCSYIRLFLSRIGIYNAIAGLDGVWIYHGVLREYGDCRHCFCTVQYQESIV